MDAGQVQNIFDWFRMEINNINITPRNRDPIENVLLVLALVFQKSSVCCAFFYNGEKGMIAYNFKKMNSNLRRIELKTLETFARACIEHFSAIKGSNDPFHETVNKIVIINAINAINNIDDRTRIDNAFKAFESMIAKHNSEETCYNNIFNMLEVLSNLENVIFLTNEESYRIHAETQVADELFTNHNEDGIIQINTTVKNPNYFKQIYTSKKNCPHCATFFRLLRTIPNSPFADFLINEQHSFCYPWPASEFFKQQISQIHGVQLSNADFDNHIKSIETIERKILERKIKQNEFTDMEMEVFSANDPNVKVELYFTL